MTSLYYSRGGVAMAVLARRGQSRYQRSKMALDSYAVG